MCGGSRSEDVGGIFRLYNVGQDTKYQPGGDTNTSYMYQVGWGERLLLEAVDEALQEVKDAAHDLFDAASAVVDAVVQELVRK